MYLSISAYIQIRSEYLGKLQIREPIDFERRDLNTKNGVGPNSYWIRREQFCLRRCKRSLKCRAAIWSLFPVLVWPRNWPSFVLAEFLADGEGSIWSGEILRIHPEPSGAGVPDGDAA